ncbi:hypothetical protein F5Y02DRAFT_255586 [Annulohypoxylon stygium]|nr:hypothetical protein F5Y02DRAFT_255586 [Annulohypoxylon stygium]
MSVPVSILISLYIHFNVFFLLHKQAPTFGSWRHSFLGHCKARKRLVVGVLGLDGLDLGFEICWLGSVFFLLHGSRFLFRSLAFDFSIGSGAGFFAYCFWFGF